MPLAPDASRREGARPQRPPAVLSVESVREEQDVFTAPVADGREARKTTTDAFVRDGLPWGRLLISAIIAMLMVRLGEDAWIWMRETLGGQTTTGRIMLALAGFAVIAAFAILVRELAGLARLRRATRLHADAEAALASGDETAARHVVARLAALFSRRPDMTWPLARLSEADTAHLNAAERLALAERELLAPLDARARDVMIDAARRVAVLTAMLPLPALDVLVVAWQALRMLRRIAALYGARPGLWGGLRLLRMAVAHLAVAGAMALSDTLLQTLLGRGLAGRLSARFGEGAVNGLLAVRLGLAAVEVVRPLPFSAVPRPSLAELARAIVSPFATDGKEG